MFGLSVRFSTDTEWYENSVHVSTMDFVLFLALHYLGACADIIKLLT